MCDLVAIFLLACLDMQSVFFSGHCKLTVPLVVFLISSKDKAKICIDQSYSHVLRLFSLTLVFALN